MKKIFLGIIIFLCFINLGRTLRAENSEENIYQNCIDKCIENNTNRDGSVEDVDCEYECRECREYYIPAEYKSKIKLKVDSKDSYSGCIDECVTNNQIVQNYVDNLSKYFEGKTVNYQNSDLKIICERDVDCLNCLNICWDELKENNSSIVDEIVRNHKSSKKYIVNN